MARRVLSRYLDSLFGVDASIWPAMISGGVLFILEVAALAISGGIEHTFYLPGGVGVFQTATWVVVAGDWALFVLIFLLTRQLWAIPKEFPLEQNDAASSYLAGTKIELLNLILLKTRARPRLLLGFFCGVGFFFFSYNLIRLSHPAQYFSFEMFDAVYFKFGFTAVRIILFTSWVLLLPYLAYVSLAAIIIVRRIISDANKFSDLKLAYNFMHPDRHGGFSYLSKINIYLLLCLLVLFFELISEVYTMPIMTLPVKIMLSVVTIVFVWLTFWFMRPVGQFLKKTRDEAKHFLRESQFKLGDRGDSNTNYLVKYAHIMNNLSFSTNTFWSAIIINGVRALSILGTVYKFSHLHTP